MTITIAAAAMTGGIVAGMLSQGLPFWRVGIISGVFGAAFGLVALALVAP